jgi:hypothetical protein
MAHRIRFLMAAWFMAAAASLAGCHTTEGPAVLQIDGGDYDQAFAACLVVGRDMDMPPALADRGNGIIETEPRSMGSLLEPWRMDTSGPSQGLESTLQFQRRRVRFVFLPEGFEPSAIDGQSPFDGGASPGSPADTGRFDLERHAGPLELRCVVVIERGFTPGIRPSTWSSRLATRSTDPPPQGKPDGTVRRPTQWTPVGRDEAAERTLLARVQARIQEQNQAEAESVTSAPPGDAPSS